MLCKPTWAGIALCRRTCTGPAGPCTPHGAFTHAAPAPAARASAIKLHQHPAARPRYPHRSTPRLLSPLVHPQSHPHPCPRVVRVPTPAPTATPRPCPPSPPPPHLSTCRMVLYDDYRKCLASSFYTAKHFTYDYRCTTSRLPLTHLMSTCRMPAGGLAEEGCDRMASMAGPCGKRTQADAHITLAV